MQAIDQVSGYYPYDNKEINEAEINDVPPSSLLGAFSSHSLYPSSSMIVGEHIDNEVQLPSITSTQSPSITSTQSPSVTPTYTRSSSITSARSSSVRSTRSSKDSGKITKPKNKSTAASRTTLRRQPPRNVLSLYARPYHRLRSRQASFNK